MLGKYLEETAQKKLRTRINWIYTLTKLNIDKIKNLWWGVSDEDLFYCLEYELNKSLKSLESTDFLDKKQLKFMSEQLESVRLESKDLTHLTNKRRIKITNNLISYYRNNIKSDGNLIKELMKMLRREDILLLNEESKFQIKVIYDLYKKYCNDI